METPAAVFKFGWDDVVIVDPTRGTMDAPYKAYLRDGGGLGAGNTPVEAAMGVVLDLRRKADVLQKAIEDAIERGG